MVSRNPGPKSTINTVVEEQEEHGRVGRRGRGGGGNLYHQRCSFFIWASRAQQYCLRRGTRMEQESFIQPGNSIFSCLILPLILENFSWQALLTHRTGIVRTEQGLQHSAAIVEGFRLKTTNNTVSWGKFYLDCTNRALGKEHSGLMLGPVLWIKWSKKLKRH